ncbi:hypothetical protein PENTCL1PPCAC_11259, partial [Pristionchus entomophagus]
SISANCVQAMEEVTIPCVMAVLKKAMEIDKDFHQANAQSNKKYDVKLEMIKHGLANALEEMENYPNLKEPYDEQMLHCAGSSNGLTKSDTDARIKFGEMLLFLFTNLTKAIAREKASNERKDICELSLGHHNLVNQALASLTKMAALPYIPEGIDETTVDRWWNSIEWKKILEDKNYQAKQLRVFLVTLLDLMEVSFQVKGTVVAKELITIVMAAEVLNHLGDNSLHAGYRSFLSGIDPIDVLDVATALIRSKAKETDTVWLNVSMSSLVNEMVGNGNLMNLLSLFDRRGQVFNGNNSMSSLPFLQSLAQTLCMAQPSSMSKKDYFQSIIDQFSKSLEGPCPFRQTTVSLFNLFIDAMNKRHNFLTKTLILDFFFHPLEKLNGCDSEDDVHLIPKSIHLLANLFRHSMVQSTSVAHSVRLRKLCLLFCSISLELSPTINEAQGDKKNELTSFRDDLHLIIDVSINSLPNKEMFLLWIIRQPEYLRLVELKTHSNFVNPKIQVMGESNDHLHAFPYGDVYVVASKADTDVETASILNGVIHVIIDLLKEEEKADFVYSALLEVFKAYINEDGYYNRLSEFAVGEKRRNSYIYYLYLLANTLNGYMSELNDNDDFLASSVKVDSTLKKLLDLTIISTTSVVNTLHKEVTKQKKEASLDVRVPNKDKDNVVENLGMIIVCTAKYGIQFTRLIPMLRSVLGKEMMEGIDPQLNEVIRLTALLKKLFDEMKEVPEEFMELKESFMQNEDLNSVISQMEGSVQTDGSNDTSYFNTEDLLSLLSGVIHEKGQGLITIGRLLMKRNTRMIEIYDETFNEIVLGLILNADSYVYLAAINCAAEAALAMTDKIIPFVHMFSRVVSVKEVKNSQGIVIRESIEEKVDLRCKLSAVICKVFQNLGSAAPLYAREAIDSVMGCVEDEHPLIRASAFGIIAYLLTSLANRYTIDQQFKPVMEAIKHTLMCEKERGVRRSAITILPLMLRGAGRDMIETLSDHLVDINRLLTMVINTEKDDVMIVHAQLAKEEIREALNENLRDEMNTRARQIKM